MRERAAPGALMARRLPRRAWLAFVRRAFVTTRAARVAALVGGRGRGPARPATPESAVEPPVATPTAPRQRRQRRPQVVTAREVGAILAIALIYLVAVFGPLVGVLAGCR